MQCVVELGLALLFAVALGSLTFAAAGVDADSVGTFQVNLTLSNQFDGNGVACPAGSSETTACFHNIQYRGTTLAGLGVVTFAPYTFIWENYGSPCGRVHGQIAILVAGKGEIDVAIAAGGCWTSDNFPAAAVTVLGGSGRYAGATGDGNWEFHVANITGPLAGFRDVTWTGTLNVAGVSFDTTPPQITGATSKVVKTRLVKGRGSPIPSRPRMRSTASCRRPACRSRAASSRSAARRSPATQPIAAAILRRRALSSP